VNAPRTGGPDQAAALGLSESGTTTTRFHWTQVQLWVSGSLDLCLAELLMFRGVEEGEHAMDPCLPLTLVRPPPHGHGVAATGTYRTGRPRRPRCRAVAACDPKEGTVGGKGDGSARISTTRHSWWLGGRAPPSLPRSHGRGRQIRRHRCHCRPRKVDPSPAIAVASRGSQSRCRGVPLLVREKVVAAAIWEKQWWSGHCANVRVGAFKRP